MSETVTTLWFYLRSVNPVYTTSLPAHDRRLLHVLEDVRMVRHGQHVFVHLRSQFEWERAMAYLGEELQNSSLAPSSAAEQKELASVK